jgi:DNA-binding protein WhiA
VTDALLVETARAELAAIAPERRCDRLAESSALFHTAGTVHLLGRGALAFHLDVASAAVARRTRALLRELRVDSEIRTYTRRSFDRSTRYQIYAAGSRHALDVLHDAGVLDREDRPVARPPGRVIARRCCRGAYLRGAVLGAGSLSGEHDPHLEVRFHTHAGASFLRAVASTEDVPLAIVDRDAHSAVYAKAWDAIEGYLAAAGAAETVLLLEERTVVAGARARANRVANADHANLERQAAAAERQLAAVRRLAATGRLEQLPWALRDTAALRRRHPAISLRELALRTDPPASASTVQKRLARLVELAETG